MKNLILWMCLCFCTVTFSQKSTVNYYYYHGQKIYINKDMQRIAVSTDFPDISLLKSYFPANATISKLKADNTSYIDANGKRIYGNGSYYAEVIFPKSMEEAEYNRQFESAANKPGIVEVSPCFVSEGNDTIGLTNNLFVKLHRKEDIDRLREAAKKFNLEVLGYIPDFPLLVALKSVKTTTSGIMEINALFNETGDFEFAEPDFLRQPIFLSSDPLFGDQWGIKNTGQNSGVSGVDIKAEQAWEITKGSGIKVAVYDTGIEGTHPDLTTNMLGNGTDIHNPGNIINPPSVTYWAHATAVAGIIAARQNTIGMTGVAPESNLLSVSWNSDPVSSTQIYAGFAWAANPTKGAADVINCSWGFPPTTPPSTICDAGIEYARDFGRGGKGTLIVFSAGNSDTTPILYPANTAYTNIITVGAISPCGQRKSSSSCDNVSTWSSAFGSTLDVVAPGVFISTTDRQGNPPDHPNVPETLAGDYNPYDYSPPGNYSDGNYTRWFSGTSASAPFVAGVAALVLAVDPTLDAWEVKDILEQSAQKISPLSPATPYPYVTTSGRPNGTWCSEMGYGLVNADRAVLLANPCPDTQNIITDVPSGTDQRQANTSITANNKISSGAVGIYHANTAVVLKPGFHAANGSRFRGYISTCTGTYVGRPANNNQPEDISNDVSEEVIVNDNIAVYPNPFENTVTLSSGNLKMLRATVTSIDGKRILAKSMSNETQYELNTSDWAKGIYILTVETESGKTFINKIVKK